MNIRQAVAFWLALALIASFASSANAGASRPVTKPPVQPPVLTGPPVDPPAISGQWFQATGSGGGAETYRTHEFYDDPPAGFAGAAAISGHVIAVAFFPGPPPSITSFVILATIVNDNVSPASYMNGTNSHGESIIYTEEPYTGTLRNVKLTASFAVTDPTNTPPTWIPPYYKVEPFIVAENEDQAAWYCWNPDDPDPTHNPKGAYYVPTWDFGDIPPGQSATRSLRFSVPLPGMPPTDPRYAAIMSSYSTSNDILFNRSLSLKISDWLDTLSADDGSIIPQGSEYGSDVSVFHDIEQEEEALDFGDAPDPSYPTLLINNGARHVIVPGIQMGVLVDGEADGQPDATATGDDLAGVNDEDGVTFAGPLYIGQSVTVKVACSTSGSLWAWIDFNTNGTWLDMGEQVFGGAAVSAGMNTLTFTIPPTAATGTTFARFRFTTWQNPLTPSGWAPDGEVEDYMVRLEPYEEYTLDFGDAWDGGGLGIGYPTRLAQNGARHAVLAGVYLGARVDTEPDGQPTLSADGDDLNPPMWPDDEDGVILPSVLYAGATAQVIVVASTAGFLNAWIDFNANLSWADLGEQVFNQIVLGAGTNVLSFVVPMPPQLVAGGPHSRWRFTQTMMPGLSYTGLANDGEVEDHEVHLEALDFGDAPASYGTLLGNDGARHRIPSVYWLGAVAPDAEPDGQPDASALGDDLSNVADEDGVSIVTPLVRGDTGVVAIVASTNGILDVFMDWNANGTWADPNESLLNVPLSAGTNLLYVPVPITASVGPTYARFRFGSLSSGAWSGLASDGEVEDYQVIIYQKEPSADVVLTNASLVVSSSVIWVMWNAESNVVYETQATTNMLDATNLIWTPWGGYVIGPNYQQQDTDTAAGVKSYRIVVPYVFP